MPGPGVGMVFKCSNVFYKCSGWVYKCSDSLTNGQSRVHKPIKEDDHKIWNIPIAVFDLIKPLELYSTTILLSFLT